jgi:hypothetical protein
VPITPTNVPKADPDDAPGLVLTAILIYWNTKVAKVLWLFSDLSWLLVTSKGNKTQKDSLSFKRRKYE